jgi:hypothetical protein
MDGIRPNRKKFARNFWGQTATARIRPVRPKNIYCVYIFNQVFRAFPKREHDLIKKVFVIKMTAFLL